MYLTVEILVFTMKLVLFGAIAFITVQSLYADCCSLNRNVQYVADKGYTCDDAVPGGVTAADISCREGSRCCVLQGVCDDAKQHEGTYCSTNGCNVFGCNCECISGDGQTLVENFNSLYPNAQYVRDTLNI